MNAKGISAMLLCVAIVASLPSIASADTRPDYELELAEGWNLVSFGGGRDTAIALEDLQVQVGETTLSWVEAAAYDWLDARTSFYEPGIGYRYCEPHPGYSVPTWSYILSMDRGYWVLTYRYCTILVPRDGD